MALNLAAKKARRKYRQIHRFYLDGTCVSPPLFIDLYKVNK